MELIYVNRGTDWSGVIRNCGGVVVEVSGGDRKAALPSPGILALGDPGQTYLSNAQAVATIGVRTAIITTAHLPEAVAYEITKATFEHINDFRRLHPDFATLLPRVMVPGAGGVPVHPAAARYYGMRGSLPP